MTSENDTERADALIRKGIRLAANDKVSDAIACLQEALACASDRAFGHLHLGLALAREGRSDEMGAHLERALELQPGNAAFRLFCGRVHFDTGDYATAARDFARGTEISAENDLISAYRVLNDWASGNEQAPMRLDPDRLPDSSAFLARFLTLMEAELKGRAVAFSEERLQVPLLDRVRIGYALWRGGLERKRGRFVEAAAQAEMALELQPGHPAATGFLEGCHEAALAAAQRRVEEAPDSPDHHMELADRLADAERYEEAEVQIELTRELLGEEKAAEAMARPEISRVRGRIAYGLGRFEEALDLQRVGAEPGFTMVQTHYCVGLCYLAMGQRQQCIREFEALVEKVCWVVPERLREYLAWRSATPESEAGT